MRLQQVWNERSVLKTFEAIMLCARLQAKIKVTESLLRSIISNKVRIYKLCYKVCINACFLSRSPVPQPVNTTNITSFVEIVLLANGRHVEDGDVPNTCNRLFPHSSVGHLEGSTHFAFALCLSFNI